MAKVKILLEGYTNADKKAAGEEESSRCTTALVYDNYNIIITDPGILESQQIMIDALAKEHLTVDDITHVFITHSHMDHYRNIGMFPDAKAVDYWGIWHGGQCDDLPENFSQDIKIINTPGHSYDGLTMLAKTDEGTIAIVGDVWWSSKGPKVDKFAIDLEGLQESRKKVQEFADYIIPGHGKMFGTKELMSSQT